VCVSLFNLACSTWRTVIPNSNVFARNISLEVSIPNSFPPQQYYTNEEIVDHCDDRIGIAFPG